MQIAVLLFLVVSVSLCDAECGPWTPCRKTFKSLMPVLQSGIQAMEDNPKSGTGEMSICDPGCKPCEQVILKNLRTVDLCDEDPCSRQHILGNEDIYDQYVPMKVSNISVKCTFSNEITFIVSLLQFLGEEFTKLVCKIPVMNVLPCCLADAGAKVVAGAGDAIKGGLGKIGLGKRDVNVEKRAAEKPCHKQVKTFFMEIHGRTCTLKMNMTNDWDKEITNVTDCNFSQESYNDLALRIGGNGSLLGPIGDLLTNKLDILGRFLGMLLSKVMNPTCSKIIKDNPQVKEYIGAMNCGD